ncbi:MAG: peptide MFS transporter [Bacteroidales bacterium]|nr:peptide MFS transporter [Bacteroidales bacterium]MBN2698481.1 peptide MFS transporter [Bacteroidales bacterium]
MFKGHPKGLYVAFFANMGERFGFYTMMACLVFFLQARFNLGANTAGSIYSWYYFFIYALALIGGFIADKTQNFKGTILSGIITMLAGYVLMSIPGLSLSFVITALFVIAFGNGLFKGNLQAIVGQLYDDPKYNKLRDTAFNIFYMGINIGAFFAPSAANGIRNWYLKSQGFAYNSDLAWLSNQYLEGTLTDTSRLTSMGEAMTGSAITDVARFSQDYIDAFSTGYNFAFAVAGVSMIISMIIFLLFKKRLPDRKKSSKDAQEAIRMPWAQEKPRIIALLLVFIVVIFFWMSFHQNGLTLSFFARDYTASTVGPITKILFSLKSLLPLIGAIFGIFYLLRKGSGKIERIIGALLTLVGGGITYYFYTTYSTGQTNAIEPEIFQQFNPIFIVFLTPLIIGFFAWQRNRNAEPSTPKKIGIGMLLAALGFVVIMLGSFGLPSPEELGGAPSPERVSPYWLINTYLVLTIAELYLSPMGLSFVSKVSPPRFQGLMQGGWLFATAIGNKLLFVGSRMWERIDLWQLWLIFVVCCLLSAAFIFSILKRLERLTKDT